MATMTDTRGRAQRDRRADALDFRLIYLTAFVVMVVAAAIERALPWNLLERGERRSSRKSVLGQAREAANTCATYALMG